TSTRIFQPNRRLGGAIGGLLPPGNPRSGVRVAPIRKGGGSGLARSRRRPWGRASRKLGAPTSASSWQARSSSPARCCPAAAAATLSGGPRRAGPPPPTAAPERRVEPSPRDRAGGCAPARAGRPLIARRRTERSALIVVRRLGRALNSAFTRVFDALCARPNN